MENNPSSQCVRLALPKGRMKDGVFSILAEAGIRVKVSERDESEHWNFLEGLWLFMPLVKTRPMGRPWDNVLAKRWWALGRHVRQKEPAPSAEVRRATQQAVHAPPTRLRAPAGES